MSERRPLDIHAHDPVEITIPEDVSPRDFFREAVLDRLVDYEPKSSDPRGKPYRLKLTHMVHGIPETRQISVAVEPGDRIKIMDTTAGAQLRSWIQMDTISAKLQVFDKNEQKERVRNPFFSGSDFLQAAGKYFRLKGRKTHAFHAAWIQGESDNYDQYSDSLVDILTSQEELSDIEVTLKEAAGQTWTAKQVPKVIDCPPEDVVVTSVMPVKTEQGKFVIHTWYYNKAYV